MSHYCTEVEGQAWSLACGQDSITYLQHEADLRSEIEGQDVLTFSAAASAELAAKGFDFTSAQQTPSFSAFGAASQGKSALVWKSLWNGISVVENLLCFLLFIIN